MDSLDSTRFVEALRRFAATLVAGYDLTEVLEGLCRTVVDNLPVDGAGVAVADLHGALRFAAASDDRVRHLETIQEQTGSGPCRTAFDKGEAVVIEDLEDSEDWPTFRHAALAAGLHTVVALPMQVEDRRVGVLDLFGARPTQLNELQLDVAYTLAQMATSYVLHVREQRRTEDTAAQLQYALSHRVVVEQAKGLLAGRHGISVDTALVRLRGYARYHGADLRKVARRVLDGDLDL